MSDQNEQSEYERNEKLQQIREKHGGRAEQRFNQQNRESGDGIESEFRTGGESGREASDEIGNNVGASQRNTGDSTTDSRIDGKADSRERYPDSEINESDRSTHSHSRKRTNAATTTVAKKNKPKGLATKPNRREKAERIRSSQPKKDETPFVAIPLDEEDKSKSQPKKAAATSQPKALSANEADELQEQMIDAFRDYCEYIDAFIMATNKQHIQAAIWAMDEKDLKILVDSLLGSAKKSGKIANRMNWLVSKHKSTKIFKLLIPRLIATVVLYKESGVGIR